MSEKWVHGKMPGEDSAQDAWKDGIVLTINGGKDHLDSATIPVEWHFTPEMIAEKPQYIMVIDHEMPLETFKERHVYNSGVRHEPVKVTDFVKYVQLFKTGIHHLVFIVFCGTPENAKKRAYAFFKRIPGYGEHKYDRHIEYDYLESGRLGAGEFAYATHVEINVPDELLAHKPDSGFSGWYWNWLNGWFRTGPVDECEWRKRKWFFAPVLILCSLIGRGAMGILGSLYVLVGSLLLILLGWRPENPLKKMHHFWQNRGFRECLAISMYTDWRVWEKQVYERGSHEYKGEDRFIPYWCISWYYIIGTIVVRLLYRAFKAAPVQTLAILFLIIIAVALIFAWIGLTFLYRKVTKSEGFDSFKAFCVNYTRERRIKNAQRRYEQKQRNSELFDAYYMDAMRSISLDTAPAPQKVNISAIIKKAKAPIKFKLSFWATKQKVCKPFAR